MAQADVLAMPETMPTEVKIDPAQGFALTPNQIRKLKEATGRTLTELMDENADDADRFQAMAWIELTRRGFTPTWDEAGDVAIRTEIEMPDPTKPGR